MNVLFILLDDLGWNDVGVNNENVKTPNIDYIVKDGCLLEHNYTFPVCGPTRAMIQTGKYAYKYGMQKLFDPWIDYGLDINLKLMPQYLKNLNYSSYAIGKWHLGHNQRKFLPHKRGYDYYFGHLTGCVDHISHKHGNPLIQAQKHDFSENGKPIYPKGHSCELLTNKALEIIENKTNNFLIYLAYLSPHVPIICPNEFKKFYENTNEPRKSYLGMITHLDFQIGKIIKKLKDKNLYEETLIWIMSDNGGWATDWAAGENFPLKGGKASFYEGGTRTFSVLRNNKKIKIKKNTELVHCVDVLPTILDFCGHEKVPGLDGISLFNSNRNRNIVIGFYGQNHWCFIIDNLKFIKLKKISDHHMSIIDEKLREEDINCMECYDIINDPIEKNNIIKEKFFLMKNKLQDQVKICLSDRVYENFNKISIEESIKKCKDIKFWGQQKKQSISVLNDCQYEDESKKYINSKDNLLELTGYDVFYN